MGGRFALKAGNGEIVATFGRSATNAAVLNSIQSMKTNALAAKFDDETGE